MSSGLSVSEKSELISRDLQEILGKDEMMKILEKRDLRVYWGTATTGKPHIGYFVPMVKISDFLSGGCEMIVLLADLHAVLDNLKAPLKLVEARCEYYRIVIQAMLRRIGAPMKRITFIKGSEFQLGKEYIMDMHKLSTIVGVHDAQRAGAEVVKQTNNPLLSSLVYPGMQALDEEYLKVDAQFGGIDQRKIFIYAEKYMPALGYKKRIHFMNKMVPGLGAGKMSSSDENSKIGLTDTDAQIKKKISKAFCEEGKIEPNGVLSLVKSVIIPLQRGKAPFSIEIYKTKEKRVYTDPQEVEKDFEQKILHPGDLKQAVTQYLIEFIAPIREEILQHKDLINKAYPE
ncbi:tyrosyl-tRNA synthetase [Nematocida sp. LUAm3]|nr:tyrosyl-tRNA synthetase [Nematocida sp. LUAm3]KAI5176253.1 tyrosyl-tRNA synthetase [Nematocida sp. LUAm2]KAI5176711.1 tyrosyl-tRNA synthetase [Nematocida sp. LUAm1]